MLFWSWTASRHRIVAHDATSRTLLFDRPSRQPLGSHLPQSGRRFLLEGLLAALDAPGEFAVRAAHRPGESSVLKSAMEWLSGTGSPSSSTSEASPTLMYLPRPSQAEEGISESEALGSYVAASGLTTLLRAEPALADNGGQGSGEGVQPLRRLRLDGLAFEHADWELPEAPQMADWQGGAFLEDAALLLRHIDGATVSNVHVRHVGGYAMWLREGATNCTVERCVMRDLGGGGVRIGSMELSPANDTAGVGAVRPPLAEASHNVLAASRVVNGGHVFREGVGVLVHRSRHNSIAGNEIAYLGYTGVSLGWEWGYAQPSGGGHNRVLDNFIHHIGRWELADMGGVYVLGVAEGTLIEGNVIAHVAAYHMYAWGTPHHCKSAHGLASGPPPSLGRFTCLRAHLPAVLGVRVSRRHLSRRGCLAGSREAQHRAPHSLRRAPPTLRPQQHDRRQRLRMRRRHGR